MMQTEIRDRRTAFLAAGVALLMVAHLQGGKTVRDALFLNYFDVTALPKMMIGTALVSALAVGAFALMLTRYGPARLTPPLFLLSGILSVGEWAAMAVWPQTVTVAIYLHVTVLDALLISGFWSILNERYDPYTAKTIIGRITIFTALGGLCGAGAASIVARAVDIRAVIAMLAVFHLASGLALLALTHGQAAVEGSPAAEGRLRNSVRNPLIQRVALLMLSLSATVALLDYLFKATIQSSLSGEELVTFFAFFYMAIDIGTFLLQSFVGRKALHWFGLGGTIAILPLSLFSGTLLTFAFRSLISVTLLRAAANLLTNSFFGPGYELLYTPIATAEKRMSKILIDVGANRAGNMLGGLLIMGLLLVPGPTDSYILLSTMVCAGIMGLLIFLLSRGYLSQLVANLQKGHLPARSAVIPEPAQSAAAAATSTGLRRERLLRRIAFYRQVNRSPAAKPRPRTVNGEQPRPARINGDTDSEIAAIQALRSGETRRIRHVLVNQVATPGMLPHILPLLRNRSVLKEALAACRPLAATATGQMVDVLLDQHQHALVRRRIPLLLGLAGNMQAVHGLIAGLEDRAPDVRYRCAEALARLKTDYSQLTIDPEAVWRVIYREMTFLGRSGLEPRQGVEPLRHLFHLFGLIFGVPVMDVCYDSLQAPDDKIRGTALEYLENRLPPNVKSALWPIIASGRAEHTPSNRTAEEILEALWESRDAPGQRMNLLERNIKPQKEPES
ncbi:MAG: MFS transporter [Desulfobacterales bacterium]|nr:MFS transporter [Desulfobacterales bacterium]